MGRQPIPIRSSDYPGGVLEVRRELRDLADLHAKMEQRVQALEATVIRRRVFSNRKLKTLQGFRTRAIRYLAGLDKLTYQEIGDAFGVSKQRVEQIVRKRP